MIGIRGDRMNGSIDRIAVDGSIDRIAVDLSIALDSLNRYKEKNPNGRFLPSQKANVTRLRNLLKAVCKIESGV
jgi:hypothetical protein